MRVGVICEGPSDFPAIQKFIGHLLNVQGHNAQFIPLFPEMDRTRPEGGWANVLLWLNNNPPQSRVARYFAGGLFGGALSTEPLDAIILHLDGDVVDRESFQVFVNSHYSYSVEYDGSAASKVAQISNVLAAAAQVSVMTNADQSRHILLPAVESTETWCIAVFHPQPGSYDELTGQDLVDEFMTVLERSEGRNPQRPYAEIDKSLARRIKFCDRHASGAARIMASCEPFSAAVNAINGLDS